MNIDGVNTGIVLDHIQAGKSMRIYKLLHLDELDSCVAVIQNVESTKYGKKDIIKIDEMIDIDFDVLGYVDPNITVNIVRNGKLEKKTHMALPETLHGVLECKNPRCITSVERGLESKFYLADRKNRVYRCAYCDTAHSE
jgi:aspartate carbamoyltransferase regulatory subunit